MIQVSRSEALCTNFIKISYTARTSTTATAATTATVLLPPPLLLLLLPPLLLPPPLLLLLPPPLSTSNAFIYVLYFPYWGGSVYRTFCGIPSTVLRQCVVAIYGHSFGNLSSALGKKKGHRQKIYMDCCRASNFHPIWSGSLPWLCWHLGFTGTLYTRT